MPVFARLALFFVAVGLAAAPATPSYAHDNDTLTLIQKRIKAAVDDVVSGRVFEEAMQKVREVQRRQALKSTGYNKNLPYYVPDAKPAKKPRAAPLDLDPPKQRSKAKPRKKPVVADPRVKAEQRALNELGFDAGKPDGLFGSRTAKAIKRYQELIYHPVTGKLTPEERAMLLAAAEKKRDLAALEDSEPGKGTMTYTVVPKTPSGLPRSPTATPRADKQLVTGSTPTVVKRTQTPVTPAPVGAEDDAKSALPQVGDENSFDADDPEG
ncbi:MAG: peptidoglycan-binding domain-containing protein [Pseudomonadota bacterium]